MDEGHCRGMAMMGDEQEGRFGWTGKEVRPANADRLKGVQNLSCTRVKGF